MQEKRKCPRFALETEIHWKKASAEFEEKPEEVVSTTQDLSAGGACLVLPLGVNPGDTIIMEIRLGPGESIYSRGRVAWVSSQARIKGWAIALCKGGVEFSGLTDSEKDQIDRFVSTAFDDAA